MARLQAKAAALGREHLALSSSGEFTAAAELISVTDALHQWNREAKDAAVKASSKLVHFHLCLISVVQMCGQRIFLLRVMA